MSLGWNPWLPSSRFVDTPIHAGDRVEKWELRAFYEEYKLKTGATLQVQHYLQCAIDLCMLKTNFVFGFLFRVQGTLVNLIGP